MLPIRKFYLCISIVISILVMSSFVGAQDDSVRKDLEALYAKRERAIKDKGVAALRSTETRDFWVGEDYFKPGEESMVKSEWIFEIVTKVNSLSIRIDNLKEGDDQNQMVVEAREYGKVLGSIAGGAPKKGVWLALSRDLLVRTEGGWKIKRHDNLGQVFRPDEEGEERGEEVLDNQVWQDIKALYAKRDKAFADKDLRFIESLETDDYSEAGFNEAAGKVQIDRQKANAEIEKILKNNRVSLTTVMLAMTQGRDKNEVLVDVGGSISYGDTIAAEGSADTWVRSQNGWKLKSRK